MSSTLIRDIKPDQLPQVHMPECEVRPVLKGQKALVTGASSGIGRGIATAL
ncbi:MAG: SDR family oxidoreductase, partial [Planctomycetes bacterium]|nr:SDR family oxidoreductase [Planctomycetota bacterium]